MDGDVLNGVGFVGPGSVADSLDARFAAIAALGADLTAGAAGANADGRAAEACPPAPLPLRGIECEDGPWSGGCAAF